MAIITFTDTNGDVDYEITDNYRNALHVKTELENEGCTNIHIFTE